MIFVCGAGVSRTVGFPLFRELAEAIYSAFAENWEAHPVEAAGMDAKHPAYDRALFALQHRIAGNDPQRGADFRQRMANAVQAALQPPAGALNGRVPAGGVARR